MIRLDFIRNFNLKAFFRRFTQETALVVLAYFFIFYILLNFVMKGRHQSQLNEFNIQKAHLELAKEVRFLKQTLPELKKVLYDTGDINFFISLMDKLLKENGAIDIKIAPGEVNTGYKVKRSLFVTKYKARFKKILQILGELEQSVKLNYVSQLRIFMVDIEMDTLDKVEDPILSVTMRVEFFSKQ
jgi:hypothetical protein